MQRNRWWIAVSGVGALAWTLGGFGAPASASTLSQLQQQEANLQSQLNQAKGMYSQEQAQAAQTLQAINALSSKLNQTRSAITNTDQKLASIQADLQNAQRLVATTEAEYQAVYTRYQTASKELVATQEHLAEQNQLLTAQLQLMEEHGPIGYVDVLLGANSFQDFVSRLYLLGQVANQASQEVNAVKADETQQTLEKAVLAKDTAVLASRQQQLIQERNLVASEEAATAALKSQQQGQAAVLANGISQNQQLENQLSHQEQAAESAMSYLSQEIDQVTAQIEGLLGQFNSGNLSRQQLYTEMLPLVQPIAARFGLAPALIIAVITEESGGNQSARSVTGAIGLMQLEPGTAQEMGIDPYDPYDNVVGGCTYLKQMLGYFGGNLAFALSAYNAGPGAVQSYQASHPGQIPPYTSQYVNNILSLYSIYQSY